MRVSSSGLQTQIYQRCDGGDIMELQQINNIIARAKSDLNAQEGRAVGMVNDARQIFIGQLGDIIMQLNSEIAQLKEARKEAPKVPKEEKKK
jgi:hypothetical protein